ncbi:hypothetical protein [Zavarzinia compransoris]|uniref:Uncharacterized protein n=1 Tax=Zavarzinia compransoris TaxID=1264899 RepID=A0A317EAL0_9PROT|nr:hypothetical protein [Zavarzinia compransoris]PWR23266.1 hypothetical protein DKG75_01460 [Zavarzinia compransoris]TDP46168.1 hypothetical protein DES42_104254 [Zavarzinia compransoris]
MIPQPDQKLLAWIGFPAPPYRLRGASPLRRAAGYLAAGVLASAGAALLVAYFFFTPAGRGLLIDSALALGLGQPVPGAVVSLDPCSYDASPAGSKTPGEWECPVTIEIEGRTHRYALETVSEPSNPQPRGAGLLFGRPGVYWSFGLLAARWFNALLLVVIGGGLIGLGLTFLGLAGASRRDRRLARGQVRSADLLTWQGRPWFAFIDDAGNRRFQHADHALSPLVLDGVRTTGAALVRGRHAVLLDRSLAPLALGRAPSAALLERITAVQEKARYRHRLPPQPGEPADLKARIEAVENALGEAPDPEALHRLYDAAWRLVWDSDDAEVATRALKARDAIALKLGPAAAFAALDRSRTAHAAPAAGS